MESQSRSLFLSSRFKAERTMFSRVQLFIAQSSNPPYKSLHSDDNSEDPSSIDDVIPLVRSLEQVEQLFSSSSPPDGIYVIEVVFNYTYC